MIEVTANTSISTGYFSSAANTCTNTWTVANTYFDTGDLRDLVAYTDWIEREMKRTSGVRGRNWTWFLSSFRLRKVFNKLVYRDNREEYEKIPKLLEFGSKRIAVKGSSLRKWMTGTPRK